MNDSYYLNLNGQPNGDYEVHKETCYFRPDVSFEYLGDFMLCTSAIDKAKKRHRTKISTGVRNVRLSVILLELGLKYF